MSNIIAIISQKGGVGKSTVTTLIANIFYFQFGLNIAIVDADYPQNSISKKRNKEMLLVQKNKRLQNAYEKLYKERSPYAIYEMNLSEAIGALEQLKGKHDYIFVDVTGSINQQNILAFLKSVNHFFIPLLMDDFSISSAMELYHILNDKIQTISENFKNCHLFFNRVAGRSKVDSLQKRLSANFDILPQHISAYALYERVYRSTLFPIPNNGKKEGQKLITFAQTLRDQIDLDNNAQKTLSTVATNATSATSAISPN